MTLVTPARRNDHFRASRAVTAMAGMALFGLLAALSARLEAQCTLSGSPVSFEPSPPGVSRPITLGSGFNTSLALYQNGGSGPYRLLMKEAWGYSVLDLSNPVNPTALYYHDVRFPVGGSNSVKQGGDGQSNIQTIAVSPDGQRLALGMSGPVALQTVVGSFDGGYGFTLWGDFSPYRPYGTLVQHIGSRYIAYDINGTPATVSDITTLPTSSLQRNNLASHTETTTWSEGDQASLAGNYILYRGISGLQVIDASNPGPMGNITASYPQTTITSADFGGRTIAYYSAAVDPADATKLWVLVELSALAGENSPSYGLLYVTSSLAKVSAGPIWRVPSQAGEIWSPNPGPSSALIPGNGSLFVLMWAQRASPSLLYELYSTTVAAWGFVNTSAPPGKFDIPTTFYGNFSPGQRMRGFSTTGNSVYTYLPTGSSAYVIPMSCVSVNSPALASMTVANQAGAALNDGDTVFLGDQITITPSVIPSPTSQALTGFGGTGPGWNFDFDFHAGTAYDDAGTSPRIKAPDNGAIGNPPAPPGTITVVGPCDPQVGGSTSPGSGANCWNSVTTNGAFGGGPDFAAVPAAGSTKTLMFAFEANNSLGSAGAGLFTLNWKVPAARLQSTQVLSAQPLASGSDGHPTATGFKWYFGATPTALTQAPGCTGPTCLPTPGNNTKGTYYYWLTASYANGYVTPNYAGTAAMGTYTITDFAPAFTVNGSASGPITAVTNQSLNAVNSSQRGAGISATYQYSLCVTPCSDNYVPSWSAMTDPPLSGAPPTSATIPIPATAGNYALKIRVDYTGGTAYWPDPAGVAYFPVNVVAVFPLVVTASVSPASATVGQNVTFSCSATGGLAPYSYQWYSPLGRPVGTQQTYQTTGSVAGPVTAYCFVTDSQPSPQSSSAVAMATFTGGGGGGGGGGGSVSVTVSVSPNPGTVNQTVTFSCNASGGTGSYTYQWRSPSTSSFVAGTSQTFRTSSSTPTSISAGCTATDSAGAQSTNAATVQINDVAAPPAACVDVNYAILDRDNGYISIPLSSALGIQYFGVATGQNLVFQATGTGMYSADWTFGDGGTGSGNPIWYTYTTAGTFTATVKLNSNATCSKSYRFVVAAPSGLFTARYADNSLFVSTNVESGKALSFVATDTADSYAWDFGDGSTATGKNPTHAFMVNGLTNVTFTTTLTVTIGELNWSTSQTFTVIPPPEPPKWVVPGMAYVNGQIPGTLWQSDVTIFNPDPTRAATISVAFLDANHAVDDQAQLTWVDKIVVPPLGLVASPNVLGEIFRQPLEAKAYGSLMIRGDVAPAVPVVTARSFNAGDPTKGTFGFSVPPTSVTGGVSSQAPPAASVLIGVRDDANAYTNVGLVNLRNDWPKIQLDFSDAQSAAPLASMNVDMKPYQSLQINRALQAAGYTGTNESYTVKLKILQGTAVYPFATVIDAKSTDPIVVTPSESPSNAYRIPGIVRLAGANGERWRSRFTLGNPSLTARSVHIKYSYVPCDASGCKNRVTIEGDVSMSAGQSFWADDVVAVWLMNSAGIAVSDTTSYQSSFLDVTPTTGDPNQEPLVVLGETYNETPNGHIGLQIPGYTPQDSASQTGAYKRLALTGLASTTAYRTNLALFVVAGATGKWVNVHVYSPQGTKLRDLPVYVDGFSQVQDATLFGGLPGDLSRLSIVVDNIEDGVTVGGYATIIDNRSGDATFVKAQPAP